MGLLQTAETDPSVYCGEYSGARYEGFFEGTLFRLNPFEYCKYCRHYFTPETYQIKPYKCYVGHGEILAFIKVHCTKCGINEVCVTEE